jgi:predicted ATPase
VAVETAATLLERERELTEFGNALAEVREGGGRFLLVLAAAGLGKTTLLRAASETAAEAGFSCLRARASELERDFAYGCVRQLLEPAVVKLSDSERDRLFQGAASLSKSLFAPTDAPSPSADSAFSMLHGLYWLLNNLADEGPVALCVDDLQWSDPESLRFLNYLAPRLDGLRVAVFAATRSGESVAADLSRLAAGPETTLLRPRPLSVDATAALCARRLGTAVADEFATACREATGGNPFFLEALLREAGEQGLPMESSQAIRVERIGPAAVAQAVLLRLSGAPAAATSLVRAVAVLGDGASLADAARLADVDGPEAARAADLLAALAILKPAEGLEFAHPIVREAVYADIGSHERARGMRAQLGSSPRAVLPKSESPPRSPRRSQLGIPTGLSCCAVWPRTHTRAERPPRPPPGSGERWRNRRLPPPKPRCCSSSGLPSSAWLRPRRWSTSRQPSS